MVLCETEVIAEFELKDDILIHKVIEYYTYYAEEDEDEENKLEGEREM